MRSISIAELLFGFSKTGRKWSVAVTADVARHITLLHDVGDPKKRFVQILLCAGLFKGHDNLVLRKLWANI